MITHAEKNTFNALLRDLPAPTHQSGDSYNVKATWSVPCTGRYVELCADRDRPDVPLVWRVAERGGSQSYANASEAARDVRAHLVAEGFDLPRYIMNTERVDKVTQAILNKVEPGPLYRLVATYRWEDYVDFVWELNPRKGA